MSLSYQDSQAEVYQGDAMEVLNTLPPESVHLCVTSPPYWGQRLYANADAQARVWGGDPECQHQWGAEMVRRDRGAARGATAQTGNQLREVSGVETRQGNLCALCGAWKGALGAEPTPQLYVQHIVEVFRAIRRVLRTDGVVFLNLGDSRAGSNSGSNDYRPDGASISASPDKYQGQKPGKVKGITTRNLCGIPWRVAFALQDDGWNLIDAIIWAKRNTMPESVKDRCTDAYDFIFQLTKTTSTLGWIHPTLGAVRKPAKQPAPDYYWQQIKGANFNVRVRDAKAGRATAEEGYQATTEELDAYEEGHEELTVLAEQDTPPEGWAVKHKMGWRRINRWRGFSYWYDSFACRQALSAATLADPRNETGRKTYEQSKWGAEGVDKPSWYRAKTFVNSATGANLRNCWTFSTEPLETFRFNGRVFNHFAAFPRELPRRAILLACPPYCCPQCGAGWRRLIRATAEYAEMLKASQELGDWYPRSRTLSREDYDSNKKGGITASYQTIGWQPSCPCGGNTLETAVRGVVLDPFVGSGTSLLAARELGRKAIGIDLSQDYVELTAYRLAQEQPAMMPVTEEVIDGGIQPLSIA